jgi:type 1 fimbria pilin
MLAGLMLSAAHAAADKVLTLNETVNAVTCDVSVPSTLALDSMNVSVVTGGKPDPSSGKGFDVTLNCAGGAAPSASSVGVWGTADGQGSYKNLFKNEDSGKGAAQGVGFVLTNDIDGKGTLLLAASSQATATRVTAGKAGDTLDKKTLPFYIMPYKGGYGVSVVKAGTMKAVLNFDFKWD